MVFLYNLLGDYMRKMLILFFIFAIPITILVIIDNYFDDKSEVFIEKEATTIISDILTETIDKSEIPKISNNLIKCLYTKDQKVNSVYIDSCVANAILTSINYNLSKLLKEGTIEESIEEIDLPFGMLISKALFTTLGPNINIEVLPVSMYKTDIKTDLKEYGINNSIFEVYLNVVIEVETIIPLKQQTINYNTNVLLASVIVQGEIPYYYYMGEGAIQSLPL